jgi:hypothetical protein
MARQKPVQIEVRKHGEHWAVLTEEQLVTLTVYRKGAETLEALLRGLLRYTSRKLFRDAVKAAFSAPRVEAPSKAKPTTNAAKIPKAKGITKEEPKSKSPEKPIEPKP